MLVVAATTLLTISPGAFQTEGNTHPTAATMIGMAKWKARSGLRSDEYEMKKARMAAKR